MNLLLLFFCGCLIVQDAAPSFQKEVWLPISDSATADQFQKTFAQAIKLCQVPK